MGCWQLVNTTPQPGVNKRSSVNVNQCHCKTYTSSEADTIALGRRLAGLLALGDVVSLDGSLGVGKTRLAAGIAIAFGVDRGDVTSPTFTLIHEYPTDPPLAHLDAYRLADSDEFLGLGVSELWDEGIVVVEWGSKVRDALPSDTLFVTARTTDDDQREWTFEADQAWRTRWEKLTEAVRAQ